MSCILEEATKFSIENLSEAHASVLISRIWSSNVKKVCSPSGTGSGYRNLGKRQVCEEDTNNIETLDEQTIGKLKSLSSEHDWAIEISGAGEFSLTKTSYPDAKTTIDDRRLLVEIMCNVKSQK